MMRALRALAENPRPPDARPLHGESKGLWRVRVGDYRASYLIDDEARLVRVGRVGHRSTFYKRFQGK